MHHGDHGSQYVLLLLSKTMSKHDIRPSMGSISSPWDNAAMESLMDLVKVGGSARTVYATRDEAALDLFEYIEGHIQRCQDTHGVGRSEPRRVRRGQLTG